MKSVLITGATGFLGGKLAEQLVQRGYKVTALVRNASPALEKLGVVQIVGDLANRAAIAKACKDQQQVFHCAAVAGNWGPRELFFRANVEGTRILLEEARSHQVQDFVYTSSPSVTFQAPGSQGDDESLPYPESFLSFYSETKAIAEREVLASNGQDGMRTVSLRPHLIWGPGDPHLVPRFFKAAKLGRLKILGDGLNQVDITYVDNAAWAHVQAAEAMETGKPAGKAYFISDGDVINLWQWLSDLMVSLGLPKLRKGPSASKAIFLARIIEWVYRNFRLAGEPPLTRFVAEHMVYPHYYSIEAAKRDFGYTPIVQAADGMTKTLEYFRDR
jgi:nucleoside-diphosphate-sugar epimerase